MVPFNLKVIAKFGLCSNYSQKLNECSLARLLVVVKFLSCSHAQILDCWKLRESSGFSLVWYYNFQLLFVVCSQRWVRKL